MAKLLFATGACRLFRIPRRGYSLRFYPTNLAIQFWIDPSAREDELEFIKAFVKPGERVIDVGANIGDTALALAKAVGSIGQVWAFEPHPRIYRFLCANVRENRARNITCLNFALGGRSAEIAFSDSKLDDMNRVGEGSMVVPMRRLDDLLGGKGPFALLKIDVEGYEKFVIEGSMNTLRDVLCVFFEVSTDHCASFGYNVAELLSHFEQIGFELFRLKDKRRLDAIDIKYRPVRVENLIAVYDRNALSSRTGWRLE
jgi:FkbM family methyltransferase